MWTFSNFPDNANRTELHLSGPAKTVKYMYDLIIDIQRPFDTYEEMDGYVFVYLSPDIVNRVINQLHDKLNHRHP